MSEPATVGLGVPIAPEDRARADFYALLARLYADAPDSALLQAIANAPALGPSTLMVESEAGSIGPTWDALRAASSVMVAEAAEQEYVDLFIGVGRSAVNPHASHWLTGFMMEKPLADLRATLARLGLGRRPGVTMLEDHVSALFETMRMLVAGHEDRPPATPGEQSAFLEKQILHWLPRFLEALKACPIANYYRRVAQFTQAFMALERDSFAMT